MDQIRDLFKCRSLFLSTTKSVRDNTFFRLFKEFELCFRYLICGMVKLVIKNKPTTPIVYSFVEIVYCEKVLKVVHDEDFFDNRKESFQFLI